MRALHPLAIAALEAWLATLPEEVQREASDYGEQWREIQMMASDWPCGVVGAVNWIRCTDFNTGPYHFPDSGPALVRQIRRAALENIAGREPTLDEVGAEHVRIGAYCRSRKHHHNGGVASCVCLTGNESLTRRRHAALRLLMLDEKAEMVEGATYGPEGWVTATLPRGAVQVDWDVVDAATGGGR